MNLTVQSTQESEEPAVTKHIEDAGELWSELPLADELYSVNIEAALAFSLDSDDPLKFL